ncbi:hypothetical protein NDU88_005101 [Pleurodeles waltl]|uniref:Uncharacterized protein n=1 Tax=Pleurodeles waltl TaxID=8319 RepID=A0AAV7UIZ7_PLEWA|nr:hypothetical protein NDU88_005101 [Pleurodeles waltl]
MGAWAREGAARADALQRGTRLSKAMYGGTRPALRTPGSPPRANDQPRRAWRRRSGELLPLWQRRGLGGSSGSPSMRLRSAGPRGLESEHGFSSGNTAAAKSQIKAWATEPWLFAVLHFPERIQRV